MLSDHWRLWRCAGQSSADEDTMTTGRTVPLHCNSATTLSHQTITLEVTTPHHTTKTTPCSLSKSPSRALIDSFMSKTTPEVYLSNLPQTFNYSPPKYFIYASNLNTTRIEDKIIY